MASNYISNDEAINPSHYKVGGLEAIDVIETFVTDQSPIEAFLSGQVLKYMLRWKHKNGKQDIEKAIWYATRLKNHLEGQIMTEIEAEKLAISDDDDDDDIDDENDYFGHIVIAKKKYDVDVDKELDLKVVISRKGEDIATYYKRENGLKEYYVVAEAVDYDFEAKSRYVVDVIGHKHYISKSSIEHGKHIDITSDGYVVDWSKIDSYVEEYHN